MRHFKDIFCQNKRVLIRLDLNVPLKDGVITSDARIVAALPTIKMALQGGAAVILLSHLGRPTEGQPEAVYSLAPVATRLSELLEMPVPLATDWLSGVEVSSGQIVLCENVRFQKGENANDPALSKKIAALCDIFVMDAFATAHRAQASTEGVIHFAQQACAGPLLVGELSALVRVTKKPERPVVAIVGGSKVSSKIEVLNSLINQVDTLILGGGIANTFLAAAGFPVGASLYEADFVPLAKKLMSDKVPLPVDVVVADRFSADAKTAIKRVEDVSATDMILDIGPKTAKAFESILSDAKTILWNGPVGVFELPPFAKGTEVIAHAIGDSKAFSIAGGGDTLAAIEQFHVADKISYISTGGGAFLEFLEGKPLPAVAALEKRV